MGQKIWFEGNKSSFSDIIVDGKVQRQIVFPFTKTKLEG